MKKTLFLIFIICSFFLSCEPELPEQSGNFWAYDFSRDRHYRLTAELLYEGNYCNVWVEKNTLQGTEKAELVGIEYDYLIHEQIRDEFGMTDFNYSGRNFSDSMELADWLGDNDGKLCILLLDIRDNFNEISNRAFVAGYFWNGDLVLGSRFTFGSNQRDMIYIDTYPGMEEQQVEDTLATLAHEMQHLINFVNSVVIRRVGNTIYSMDTWIDEGLSSAAEWVYKQEHLDMRVDWYNDNGRVEKGGMRLAFGLIDKGNNFFVWGNRSNENPYAVMDDYATVYLFFQWLRLQAGNSAGIYQKISASSHTDHSAVTSVLNTLIPGEGYSNWDVLLKTWLAANYLNEETGKYGYKNDPELSKIKAPTMSSFTSSSITLAPGEGVYSLMTESFTAMPAVDPSLTSIRYASLSKTGTPVHDTLVAPDRILLTYNINDEFNPRTFEKGRPETGTTTGVPIPASASYYVESGRSAVREGFLYRIDAGDYMRRNNFND